MFPSITWQSTLISFVHEIHCRVTRLTQLQLRFVHDSCDFPVVVVVGVYFWAMITHLISRNSFRVPLCLLVCVCVCVCERNWQCADREGVSQRCSLPPPLLLSPFIELQLTPHTPAPPTAQVFARSPGRWLPPRSHSRSQSEFVVCNFDFDSDSDSWPGPGLAGAI